jgi:hypothetical protein
MTSLKGERAHAEESITYPPNWFDVIAVFTVDVTGLNQS